MNPKQEGSVMLPALVSPGLYLEAKPVVGALPMGSIWVQPNGMMGDHSLVGPPPVGELVRGWSSEDCYYMCISKVVHIPKKCGHPRCR